MFNITKYGTLFFALSDIVFAAGGGKHVNFYTSVVVGLGFPAEGGVVLASFVALFMLFLLGFVYRASVNKSIKQKKLEPDTVSPVVTGVDFILDFWRKTNTEMFGKRRVDFELLVVSLFLFILTSNILGLIPGLPPATENFGMNLGLGFTVFIFYNYVGVKEHGLAYIKQFTGPFLVLAPFFLLCRVC